MNNQTDYTHALQHMLHAEIPITQQIGVVVAAYDGARLTLAAPIKPNNNQIATAFAGSLSAVVTLAGWGLLWIMLQEAGLEATIVIQDSASQYHKPITSDFTATCQKPDDAHIDHFMRMLRAKGKARLELQAEIRENDTVAMSFHGRYVARLNAQQ